MELLQSDVSRYPFQTQPPAYLRAHRYKYWFTEPKDDGSHPERWWRRVYVEEFYPTDKSTPRRTSNGTVPQAVRWMRSQVRGHSAPVLIWSLVACSVALWLLRALRHTDATRAGGQKGSPAGFEPGVTEKGVNSGEATPPDEEGKSEDEEEEEEEE
ncbi:hypothetical protein CRUP_036645, partial [Coryphaenoides rupestris]